MSKNGPIKSGKVVELVAPAGGATSGKYLLVGGIGGVAITTQLVDELVSVDTEGEFDLTKATGFAPSQGDVAYWDIADQALNGDTANVPIGHYTLDAVTGAVLGRVRVLDTPFASVSSLDARLDIIEGGSVVKQMAADGTQVAMTVSDTYVDFTADALTFGADAVADNDTVEWEAEVKIDGMNAAYLTTFDLLCGALSLDTVAITTGDTGDWAKLKGTARFTAVGASSTLEVFGGDGCNSDGGSVTRDTPTYAGAQTGPATTAPVVFKCRIKAATGNAANLATLKNFKLKLHKNVA